MAPKIWAYNWAYIFESVIVRRFESCLAGDLRVRRFVPESRDSLVSSESNWPLSHLSSRALVARRPDPP